MTRRKLFRRFLASAAIPSYAFAVEPKWLDQTFTTIRLRGCTAARPIRILQLSDLHASSVVPFSLIERAVDMGLETKPHIICVTGDFITNQKPVDGVEYRRILKKLSTHAPTYATLGNHDGGSWTIRIGGHADSTLVRQLLADSGVRLLHNQAETLRVNGQELRLAGVGDLWNEEIDADAALRPAGNAAKIPTILLAHNPDTKELVGGHAWDLMLCGHTHGGQVLLPGIGTRFVAVRDKEFISGLKQWNGRYIYISRGVGNLAGVRLNCRPEVTALEIASANLDEQHSV